MPPLRRVLPPHGGMSSHQEEGLFSPLPGGWLVTLPPAHRAKALKLEAGTTAPQRPARE